MADKIDVLSRGLDAVRIDFERYFMGLEKRPPYQARNRVAQQIRRHAPGNSAVERFKHKNLLQRLVTLEQYWGRIERAMAAGTFTRDVARADFRRSRSAPAQTAEPATRKAAGPDKKSAAARKESAARATEVGAAANAFLEEVSGTKTGKKTAKPSIKMRGKAKKK